MKTVKLTDLKATVIFRDDSFLFLRRENGKPEIWMVQGAKTAEHTVEVKGIVYGFLREQETEVKVCSIGGRKLLFDRLGDYQTLDGKNWVAWRPHFPFESTAYVRLEREGSRARFMYDPGHGVDRDIQKNRETQAA